MSSTLQDKLSNDLKEAMRSKDLLRLSTLRLIKAGIQNEEIARGKPLDDAAVIDLVSRQAKQRQDSIEQFKKGNRLDLVEKEEAELEVVKGYLPQQLTVGEIENLVTEVIQKTGARSAVDKGKVMGALMPQVRGRADGSIVNSVVSRLLGIETA
tara:strand:+ start:59 stop:520 length:462 start_codon:yes stop_codon:yes gene_type:complete